MPDRNARTGLPFRHRDWKHGISGFKASGAKQDPRTSTADAAKEGGGGDGRQRSSRRSQLPGQLRRLNAVDEPLSIDPFLVAENPADFQEKLLIDVRQFVDRNFSRKVRPGPDIPPDRLLLRSPARLMISVFYSRYGRYKLRHTDTKDCSIETYVRHGGKHLLGKVQGLTPFEITKDQLCVLRDDNSVGLADNYKLELVFETTDITAWPPLRLADDPDLAVSNTREWRLKTSVTDVLEAKHMPAAVLLLTEVDESLTVYDLKLDMRWSTGFSQAAIEKYMQQRLLPSIVVPPEEGEDRPDDDEDAAESNLSGTTCGVDHEMAEYRPKAARSGSRTPHYNMNGIINGIGGVERINAFDDINSFDGAGGFDSDDQGTENELETTPGRSLRARGQTKQYNLKLLSDQAQGKARKPRKPRVAAENGKLGEVERVNYLFLEPLNLQLADFLCCRCGASCETMSQLRLHLQNHDDLELSFHVSKNGECTIRVSLKDSSREMHGPPAQGNTFQLGRPKEILNLEKIVDGDTSWITSRFGPENEADEEKPGTSRHRSAKTSVGTNNLAKKILVPVLEDNRPAYHPISRAVLEPGTELPTVPVDESWYIHKHRDTILDYTDLHDCEIQYIFAWDAHVLLRRILSPVYLPRIWLEFIEKNAEWLVSNPLLMEELGKHLSTLRGRGLLEDDGIVRNGLEILDAARRRLESEQEKDDSSATGPGEGGRGEVANTRDPGLVTPASHKAKLSKMRDDPYPVPPKPTSVSGCGVCLKPLRGPSVLICSNEDCQRRGYHDYCIRDRCIMDPEDEDWLCDTCVRADSASAMVVDSQ